MNIFDSLHIVNININRYSSIVDLRNVRRLMFLTLLSAGCAVAILPF